MGRGLGQIAHKLLQRVEFEHEERDRADICALVGVRNSVDLLRCYHLQSVASDFVVDVRHQGKPVPNAAVSVITGADDVPPVFTARTNATGSVKIEGLQPGRYYLVATFNEIGARVD